MSWLVPHNHEFEDEKELIKIIEDINLKVNKQVNSSIGIAPIMLFNKEKEYLKPFPNKEILKQYLKDTIRVKVSNSSLLNTFWKVCLNSIKIYLEDGYDVIFNYIINPGNIDTIKKEFNNSTIKFIVLLANEDVLLARDKERLKDYQMGNRCIALLDNLKNKNFNLDNILDTSNLSIEDTINIIESENRFIISEELMNINLEYKITEDEFLEVIESVGQKTYTKDQVTKALENTMYMVKATVDGKLAGIGRVVGDYSIVCMLSDICVKPEFQGKGIGLKITAELKKLIEKNVAEGEKMQIELTPTAGNETFYEKAGFKYNPEKITGMYLWIKK